MDYATIDELQLVMDNKLLPEQVPYATRLLTVVSAGLRQIFKDSFANLDERLESGDLELIIVSQVVCDIVSRTLQGSNSPLGGDFTQLTQSAGGYSTSISSNGSNLYLRREQRKWLGLPTIAVTTLNLLGDNR